MLFQIVYGLGNEKYCEAGSFDEAWNIGSKYGTVKGVHPVRFRKSSSHYAGKMIDSKLNKDGSMKDYKQFIDSVVGNIARKIEDEFNEKTTKEELEDASPKKNRLGRNPLEKIDNSDPGDKGVGSIIKKTGN